MTQGTKVIYFDDHDQTLREAVIVEPFGSGFVLSPIGGDTCDRLGIWDRDLLTEVE